MVPLILMVFLASKKKYKHYSVEYLDLGCISFYMNGTSPECFTVKKLSLKLKVEIYSFEI